MIGHEVGHGFDDQGSKYDGDGNLKDWWTEADRKEFEARAKKLIEQYDGFEPTDAPGQHVNGALTIGENIGDLGGLTIAYKAYRLALGNSEAPKLDGLTATSASSSAGPRSGGRSTDRPNSHGGSPSTPTRRPSFAATA